MKPRLFVSTVSQEFKSGRTHIEHVLEFLGYEVVQQDIFGTEGGDLRQMLRDKIDSCEGLVQLVGDGYGAEPPSIDPDYGRVSYTQFEFLYARLQGKKTWVLFAGPACQRDTPVEKLDLPRDPAHPAPADYQAERRDLQASYRARLRSEGHLWHSPSDNTALENAVLKLRADSEELRREFRDWQHRLLQGQKHSHTTFIILVTLLALLTLGGFWWQRQQAGLDTAAIKEGQTINASRLRAHLHEASEKALAKDLTEAESIPDGWEQREKLRQAAQAAHQQRLAGIEPIIAEFARIEGSTVATDIAKELIRIAGDPAQGIPEALRYLQSQRGGILSQVASLQAGVREKLQPLLSGAQLAITAGDHAQAESLFRDLLKADPTWTEARHQFIAFLGDTLATRAQSHGTLSQALLLYQEALGHAQRLHDDAPLNTQWQRDLSVSYNKLGNVAVAHGRLEDAARFFSEQNKLAEKLAQSDPLNTEWQRDLSISYNQLGNVAVAQGRLEDATRFFTDALTLTEKLTQSDPLNTQWQRDLSISYNKLGEVAVAQGRLEDAARFFADALTLIEKLVQYDPLNTQWENDLSINYQRLGEVAVAQGRLEDAARFFSDYNKLTEKLAQSDPLNTEWQRDLSISYNKLGEIAIAQSRLEDAARFFSDALTLTEKLLQSDPLNSHWQRDLAASFSKLGVLHQRLGQWTEALSYFESCQEISERLVALDPTNATWQNDVQWTRRLVQEMREKVRQ